jgi:hypothetical protein
MIKKNSESSAERFSSDVELKTDVDTLVKLVESKKEISASDAASILKVPSQTIEAWAGFLEEEGVLNIKYKLTTPYLVAKPVSLPKQLEADSVAKKKHELKPQVKYHLGGNTSDVKEKEVELPDLLPDISKNINVLLEQAYKYMDQGKYDQAHKIYLSIKEKHEGLPLDLQGVKKDLDVKLTKLNKDLSVNIHSAHAEITKRVSKEINSNLQKLNHALNKKDIKLAEALYLDIQKQLSKFPEEFSSKKTEIETQVLLSYEKLIKQREELLLRYSQQKTAEIRTLVSEIKENMLQNNLDKAFANYDTARELYNHLPEGFSRERAQLDKEIFSLIPELIAKREEQSLLALQTRTSQIQHLVTTCNAQLKKNELDDAKKTYNQIMAIYTKLPKQLEKGGVNLEQNLIELQRELIILSNKKRTAEYETKDKKIKQLIQTARKYLTQNNVDIAEGIYLEILHHYESIPKGFLEQKTKIRVNMLQLYKDILVQSEEPLLTEFDNQTEDRYKQLVKHLIEVREHLEEGNYKILESKYKAIMKLHGKLPFALVQEKTKIWQEVSRLKKEVELYKTIADLETYRKNPAELQRLLKRVKVLYDQLSEHSIVHTTFLNFVREEYEKYHKQLSDLVSPSDSDIPALRRTALINNILEEANKLWDQANYTRAEQLFERVLQLDNTNGEAAQKLSLIQHFKNREMQNKVT